MNYTFQQFKRFRRLNILDSDEIALVTDGFEKISQWSEKAHEEGIRRRFEKRATCFPEANCGEKRSGISSTETVFLIYEDGSTASKVQRNKGAFSTGFNFSIDSSLLLASYLDYMLNVGEKEFLAGSMTEDDLDSMFN